MDLENIYMPIMDDLKMVETEIKNQIRFLTDDHKFVNEIVGYFFDAPGQRLRPALVILSAKAAMGDERKQRNFDDIIRLATIVEYIHSASLIHDDLVDGATSRREKPSINIVFGNKISVLVGDMLYAHAFKLLTERFDKNVMTIFSRCVQRMCRGEINELRGCDFEKYLGIIEDKTAVFMSACCNAGATLTVGRENTDAVQSLSDFGLNFGMAYQIMDDLKDGDTIVANLYRMELLEKLKEFVDGAEKSLYGLRESIYKESLTNLLKYIIEYGGSEKWGEIIPAKIIV
jgi:octaprenyl-diphosphate synthase